MFECKVDKAKNLIEFRLEGTVREFEAADAATKAKNEFADLAPGFTVITDITRLESNEDFFIPILREVMEFLGNHHPGKVIRIVGNESPAAKFVHAFENEYVDYNVTIVTSYEEALASLSD